VTIELMRRISAAFNSRDVERIVDCFAEDATFCLARGPEPVGRTLRGKTAIRKALADRFKQIPDMRWDHQEYILAGDHAVSLWTVRGRGSDGEELNYRAATSTASRATRSSTRTPSGRSSSTRTGCNRAPSPPPGRRGLG
jgi:ketosteroid isomerase-like protein